MENKEIMNIAEEVVETEIIEVVPKRNIGKAVGITALVVGAGFGAYKLGKKLIAKRKAKKELEVIEFDASATYDEVE